MKGIAIRQAKLALLEKSILGYRKTENRAERAIDAKVGIDKSKSPMMKAAEAKVGLPKIHARRG